jgi:phosphopantothenoylcysteine decarboxylase/phosphopantothenate--cysteine ligase
VRVIVTTGRTEERLTSDGVVITNGFTGLQGQEIARAFVRRGAEVIVISGPTALPDVDGARTIHVKTMHEMRIAALEEIATPADIYISAAAIADFSLPVPMTLRLKSGERLTLVMSENPSIVADVARHAHRPKIVVSFAAQSPEDLLAYARKKFENSGADLTVANPIGPGAATTANAAHNEVYFLFRREGKTITEPLPEMAKSEAAEKIADKILSLFF